MSVQTFLIINYSTKYIGRSTGLIELLVNTFRTFFALISDHLRQLLIPYKMSRFIFLDTHQLSYSIICRKSRGGKNFKNNMNVCIYSVCIASHYINILSRWRVVDIKSRQQTTHLCTLGLLLPTQVIARAGHSAGRVGSLLLNYFVD